MMWKLILFSRRNNKCSSSQRYKQDEEPAVRSLENLLNFKADIGLEASCIEWAGIDNEGRKAENINSSQIPKEPGRMNSWKDAECNSLQVSTNKKMQRIIEKIVRSHFELKIRKCSRGLERLFLYPK